MNIGASLKIRDILALTFLIKNRVVTNNDYYRLEKVGILHINKVLCDILC